MDKMPSGLAHPEFLVPDQGKSLPSFIRPALRAIRVDP
jgi:hypothetical protein